MGAEGPGLRERVRKTCDQLAKIPMMSEAVPGQAESLNVATAAGIALYEARRGYAFHPCDLARLSCRELFGLGLLPRMHCAEHDRSLKCMPG